MPRQENCFRGLAPLSCGTLFHRGWLRWEVLSTVRWMGWQQVASCDSTHSLEGQLLSLLVPMSLTRFRL